MIELKEYIEEVTEAKIERNFFINRQELNISTKK